MDPGFAALPKTQNVYMNDVGPLLSDKMDAADPLNDPISLSLADKVPATPQPTPPRVALFPAAHGGVSFVAPPTLCLGSGASGARVWLRRG